MMVITIEYEERMIRATLTLIESSKFRKSSEKREENVK
jgi:hypothetical protein